MPNRAQVEDAASKNTAPKARAVGPFGRIRGQSLGVLALAMSAAVVIFGIFILPHDSPAAGKQTLDHARTTSHKDRTGVPSSATEPRTTTSAPTLATTSSATTIPRSTTTNSLVKQDAGITDTTVPIAPTATQSTSTTTTTTTQAPAYVPPHVTTQNWPGNLGDPYTSASYQLNTTGGEVSASATWSGTPTLTLQVTCAGATNSQSGPTGLYVSVDAGAGSCTITLSEPTGTETSVSYSLAADFPAS
jgi:hypothetical protein